MTPQPAVDLFAKVRAWWTQRRVKRETAWDDETGWLPSLPEDRELGPADPVRIPGQRYQGRHRAVPGDIPDQPAGGAG